MYSGRYAVLDAVRNVVTIVCPVSVVTIQGTCSHSSVVRAQGYSNGQCWRLLYLFTFYCTHESTASSPVVAAACFGSRDIYAI